MPSLESWPLSVAGGGSKTGDGALDGLEEWILSVRSGPKNGLVDGV